MLDLASSLAARTAFGTFVQAGRHGVMHGPAGVAAVERSGYALAGVIARKGKSVDVAAAIRSAFGIDVPTTPLIVRLGDVGLVWSGPDQWLAIGEGARAATLVADLAGALAGLAAVVEQTDGRGILKVTGPRIRDALAKGFTIDLHPRAFRKGDAAITIVSYIGVQIWQVDDAPTYEIAVPRGFAGSFWHWFEDAAAEYGLDVG